jgi:ligand-binding sensor domain-containing protein
LLRSSNTYLSRSFRFSIAIVCLGLPAVALDPGRAIGQYVHDRWGPEKGFPGGPVYAITQTADGYLWIGAEAGLFRFDGFAFTSVRDSGPDAFGIDHVLGLSADSDGSLWVQLSDPTLLRYRDGTFTAVTPNPRQGDSRVTTIAPTSTGGLLLASRRDGAVRWIGSKFETLATATSLPASPVISIAGIRDGDVWLGTRESGVIHLRGHQVFRITKGLPDLKVNCLLAGKNGQMLAGTDRGMVRWDGSEFTAAGVPRALDHAQILSMTRDRDSNIWIGTDTRGLLRLNEQGLSSLNERGSSAPITALFEDREGDIWIGSASGIERLRDTAFITYSSAQGLPKENNGPVYADSRGRVWWAPATGGLYWLSDGNMERVKEAGLDQDVVYSITGGHNDLWLGRQRGGLTHLSFEGNRIPQSFAPEPFLQYGGCANMEMETPP